MTNGKRSPAWPVRGTPGGFLDFTDSEAREAEHEARRHAHDQAERDAAIARIGEAWRLEIAAEQQDQRAA